MELVELVYVLIFLVGMITSCLAIRGHEKYIERKKRRDEKKRTEIQAEEDGWIKTDRFAHWESRITMEKWREDKEDDLEMYAWIKENIKGCFNVSYIYGNRYIKFDKDEEAVAFKLRWI